MSAAVERAKVETVAVLDATREVVSEREVEAATERDEVEVIEASSRLVD